MKPGLGTCWLAACLLGTAVFVGWAARTPPLEWVWRTQIELRTGQRPALSPAEFDLLQHQLLRHPELCAILAGGSGTGVINAEEDGRIDGDYAYLVRKNRQAPGRLRVLPEGSQDGVSVGVLARSNGAVRRRPARAGKPFVWKLPNDGPFPQLVEVRLERRSRNGKTEAAGPRVRVSLSAER